MLRYKRFKAELPEISFKEEKLNQELSPYKSIRDSFKKVLITIDTITPYYTDDGIYVLNVYDFLLKPELIQFYKINWETYRKYFLENKNLTDIHRYQKHTLSFKALKSK